MFNADDTLFDLPDVELDAELAQRILDEGDAYTQGNADLAQVIYKYRGAFRDYLSKQNYIQALSDEANGFDLAAVDGASIGRPHGGGSLVVAAAYKVTVNEEKQRGTVRVAHIPNNPELAAYATMLRVHLELSLLTHDKLDADLLVVLDHSFWGVMQAVSRALAAYKSSRQRLLDSGRDPDTDAMQHAWQELFEVSLSADGSLLNMTRNKQVISLAKTGMSQHFVNLLFSEQEDAQVRDLLVGSQINDRALLRHVLQPGEFTTPRSIFFTEQEKDESKRWKRSRFVTNFDEADMLDPFVAREQVFDEYGLPKVGDRELPGRRLFVTYYRPYGWSRVYRVEFHEPMLASKDAPSRYDLSGRGDRLARVLASVRQSINAEIKEPLCQVLADGRSKSAVRAAISLLQERAFYQLREKYSDYPGILDIVDTLLAEERT